MTSRTPRRADATPSAGTKGESPEIQHKKRRALGPRGATRHLQLQSALPSNFKKFYKLA
ncbi:UNVERIFIED_CONTAM: hypothetical protein FKN15_004762 [Acipenser sinensis]